MKKLIRNAVLLIALWVDLIASTSTLLVSSPVIELSDGMIRGSTAISRQGKQYSQFLGIRYAQPPIGSLRFEPPERPDKWTGVMDTTRCKPECLQYDAMFLKRIKGVEDCLYLNVYSPNILNSNSTREEQASLPVFVFLHGGGFFSGNPRMYDGKYFMDENVVLVVVWYRLSSFGFLSTGDDVIRGNMGLKDQNLSLQWVQENIAKFGGNPNLVVLFGESSGAASVHLHMLSPMSKGLFHRAISQTGSSLRRYPNTVNLEDQARSLAKRVGCTEETTTREIADCLKKVDALKIVETHRDVQDTLRSDYSVYGPIVEQVKDEKAFLTEEPETLLKEGNFNHDRSTVAKLDSIDGWRAHLSRLLRYDDDNLEKSISVADRIRKFYFGDDGLPSDPRYFQNLTNMFSDRMYFLPTYNTVQLQASQSPVYLYYFDYKTMGSVFKVVDAVQLAIIPAEIQIARYFVKTWINENILGVQPPSYGAAHGDELFLLFNLNVFLEARQGSIDYDASRVMVKAWTDFAKGDKVFYDGVYWPAVDLSSNSPLKYLRIANNSTTIIDDPIEERMKFWKSLDLTFLGNKL
ncbi:Venom carboxylesterase-6 [Folsomia candida]|uniref:Carboxylic ester hydrolase n=1 Tax=Folsomia candida TaxID=158441 RepID=A0A226ES47_FOLCA|nr:Venom carboxylesterase-6 [Folsomia candida]